MTEQAFGLVPFPAPKLPVIAITGKVSFQNDILSLDYVLSGDITHILFPPVSHASSRKDELWKATCFEFFLAREAQPGYWEFNLSPSGDWNVYRMDAYRRIGFQQETKVARLPFEIKRESGAYSLHVSVDLAPIIGSEPELQLGVTVVIQTNDGNETYWALTHPAPNADFHLRESFTLLLAGQNHPLEQSARGG
jgi:hypothetical protein